MPPTVLFHGTEDTIVPYVAAEMFTEKMLDMGNRCELYTYPGAGHSFFNKGEYFRDTVEKMDAFLTSLGYLEAE